MLSKVKKNDQITFQGKLCILVMENIKVILYISEDP